jgi:cystathionine gamma-synthase
MKKSSSHSFSTRAVHAGERVQSGKFTPVSTPIHPSVGFTYESMDDVDAIFDGKQAGWIYPRYGSPTIAAFETAMANLEGGEASHAFASGMAALHLALLAAGARPGAVVVAALDIYGATYTLLNTFFASQGVSILWVDVANLLEVERVLVLAKTESSFPPILLAETLSNPLIKVADLPALGELARQHQACLLIDNTFASPYLCTPLEYGASYVIHSATKYIAGHGDVMAGVVICDQENRQRLYELNKLAGSVLGPFEAWLALRGVKTLPLRMQQQCSSANLIATRLAAHPAVTQVNYPGLSSHPQHHLAQSLFGEKGFGGMLSFEVAGASKSQAFRLMESLKLIQPATTLGDIYTLALHPATSSHRSLTPSERANIGISDGLIRLSIGIESPDDIWADLEQALG